MTKRLRGYETPRSPLPSIRPSAFIQASARAADGLRVKRKHWIQPELAAAADVVGRTSGALPFWALQYTRQECRHRLKNGAFADTRSQGAFRLMRVLATVTSIVLLAMSLSAAANARQNGVRVLAEASDVLIHSALDACNAVDSRVIKAPERLRIATWNIRAARSAPLDVIAAEVAAMQADVIGLQEVDVRTRRSGFLDEPEVLATALGFHYVFAASIKWDEGDYGLAILSRWPLTEIRRHRLDSTTATEPRIILEVTICAAGRPLRVFNHHADSWVGSREVGFAALRGILHAHMGRGLMVVGDFNEQPDGAAVRALIDAGLVDLGAELGVRMENRRRIDYLLADGLLASRASSARVWPTDKSDHHAMMADLEW